MYYLFKSFHRIIGIKKKLETQGVKIYKKAIEGLRNIMLEENEPIANKILNCEGFKQLLFEVKDLNNIKETHPKCKILIQLLKEFFTSKKAKENNSKVIIFTENWLNVYILKESLENE